MAKKILIVTDDAGLQAMDAGIDLGNGGAGIGEAADRNDRAEGFLGEEIAIGGHIGHD